MSKERSDLLLYSKHSKLLIVGASGHAKVICDLVDSLNLYEQIDLIDDFSSGTILGKFNIVGTTNTIDRYIQSHDLFVAIGDCKNRKHFVEKFSNMGFNMISLIHPNATVSNFSKIGKATVIMAGAIVQAHTVLGDGVIVNTSSTVDHDNIIGNYTHIAIGAHLAGNVVVGEESWIGAGATVIQGIKIIGGSFIGAGAVVVNSISEAGTYIGIPARIKE